MVYRSVGSKYILIGVGTKYIIKKCRYKIYRDRNVGTKYIHREVKVLSIYT